MREEEAWCRGHLTCDQVRFKKQNAHAQELESAHPSSCSLVLYQILVTSCNRKVSSGILVAELSQAHEFAWPRIRLDILWRRGIGDVAAIGSPCFGEKLSSSALVAWCQLAWTLSSSKGSPKACEGRSMRGVLESTLLIQRYSSKNMRGGTTVSLD